MYSLTGGGFGIGIVVSPCVLFRCASTKVAKVRSRSLGDFMRKSPSRLRHCIVTSVLAHPIGLASKNADLVPKCLTQRYLLVRKLGRGDSVSAVYAAPSLAISVLDISIRFLV